MYRACEAYANGAISNTEYAVMLSRYDDTMVTMLFGELAAGSFGRRLAAIGSGGGAGEHSANAEEDRKTVAKLGKQIAQKDQQIESVSGEIKTKEDQKKADPTKAATIDGDIARLKEKKGKLESERDELRSHRAMASRSAAQASAFAVPLRPAVALQRQESKEVAALLEKMQRNYLHDVNSDALAVACLSVMSDIPGSVQHSRITARMATWNRFNKQALLPLE